MPKEISLESRVAHSFIVADRMHHKVIDKYIGEIGLHRSQHMLLMQLSKGDGALSQRELAEQMQISPCALSVRIKKLESDGYITRSSKSGDSRINDVKITERGQGVVKRSHAIFKKVDSAMINGLSEDEIAVFMQCLEKINGNLIELYERGKL